MGKNLYETLGVDKKAKKSEIKRAYRRKAKENHPDKGGKTEDMIMLNKAYRILINDKLRLVYDKTGNDEEQVDMILTKATELVTGIFISIINTYKQRTVSVDYLKTITNEISERLVKIGSSIEMTDKAIETVKELFEDVEFVGKKKPDILHITLAQQMQMLERERLDFEKQKEIMVFAKEIVKWYKKKRPVTEQEKVFPRESFASIFANGQGGF